MYLVCLEDVLIKYIYYQFLFYYYFLTGKHDKNKQKIAVWARAHFIIRIALFKHIHLILQMGMDVKCFRGVLTPRFSHFLCNDTVWLLYPGTDGNQCPKADRPLTHSITHKCCIRCCSDMPNTHPYSSCVCTNTLKSTGCHIQRPQYLQIECGLHDGCKHELLSSNALN